MACVAVNSLVRTIELEFLQPLPRPIIRQKQLIPGNEKLIQNLHQKLGDLIEVLDENRMDGIQAIKHLETKLRDVAFRVEDEIEFQIVHLYEMEEKEELLAGIAGLFVEEEELLAAIAGLFVEIPESSIDAVEEEEEEDLGIAADLFVEKSQAGETDAQRSGHSLKLGCILEGAIRDIDAIHKELSKVKMECVAAALQGIGIGRKTTIAASTTCCSDVMMMAGDSSHHQHASHSQPLHDSIMVGKNNEFHIVKAMLIQHSSRQREIVSIQGMGGMGKTTLARRVYEDPYVASRFDIRAWVVVSQYHNKLQMLTDLLKSMGCVVDCGAQEDQLAEKLYQNLMHQRYFVVIDDIWSVEAWESVKACFPDNGNGSRVLLTTRSSDVATIIGSNNDFSHQMQLLEECESWNLFHEKTSKSLGSEFDTIRRQIVDKCKGLPLAIVVAAGLFSKLHTLDEWKNVAEALNSSAITTIDEECSRILSSSYNHLPHSLKACFLYLSIFPEDNEIPVKDVVKLWVAEGLVKASKDMRFDAVARRHIQELKGRNLILVSQPSSCGRKVKAFRMHDILHSFCVREAKKENLLHVVNESESNSPLKDFRWVSIQSKRLNKQTLYSSSINCRSIFHFSGRYTSLNSKISPLLRVLYNTGECEMAYLFHLRCVLSLSGAFTILDPFRSWNLQTLSVDRIDKMSLLEFPQLQHFYSDRPLRDFTICFHQNLKSIGMLRVDQCTKEFFTSIPYVENVMIYYVGGWNDCMNNIAYLHQLQSLFLLCCGRTFQLIPNHNCIVSLKNLMKLRFYCVSFEGKTINMFSKLPKLEVLLLRKCKWIGGEWELLEKESFDHLIYLEISRSNLERWEASACHFPNLECLKGPSILQKFRKDPS
ncbi:PREDICTED: putative disease resistance RPP13-like protein 3 isoform X2 [Ipomoea nil]|uniref:putative disease resistance RPP13-like protein 3 isoform X2 n=1 Tax=Ipomoea nil TaxID=35883 RepID=UPI000900F570|nr:PREDICTED: putative disease resistance RPP13-like protein 3 isoform X2 [Ipomoea nil]